jgi:rod shape-determining protein MreC
LVNSFWNEYVNLREVRNENEALREKVSELMLLNQRQEATASEARRLQMILDLKTRTAGKNCAASVIARSPTFLSFTILLDRGSNQGVRKDNPVITTDGVVGRVVDTHASTCEVQVLVDSDAAAGAIISRTRIQGVLNGRGGLLLKLNYLLNQEDVQVGDLVVTSGLDNVYPKDLPLGRVVRVSPGESVFKEIEVFPLVNFNKLEEVLILLEAPSKP